MDNTSSAVTSECSDFCDGDISDGEEIDVGGVEQEMALQEENPVISKHRTRRSTERGHRIRYGESGAQRLRSRPSDHSPDSATPTRAWEEVIRRYVHVYKPPMQCILSNMEVRCKCVQTTHVVCTVYKPPMQCVLCTNHPCSVYCVQTTHAVRTVYKPPMQCVLSSMEVRCKLAQGTDVHTYISPSNPHTTAVHTYLAI